MATYIEMPKLSDTMTEGTLLKWRKNEGDKVETGDILAEIEAAPTRGTWGRIKNRLGGLFRFS